MFADGMSIIVLQGWMLTVKYTHRNPRIVGSLQPDQAACELVGLHNVGFIPDEMVVYKLDRFWSVAVVRKGRRYAGNIIRL